MSFRSMATIIIPSALRLRQNNLPGEFEVEAETVGDALRLLTETFPGLNDALFQTDGALRSTLRVFVDAESIDRLNGLETPLGRAREIFLLLPIAGG